MTRDQIIEQLFTGHNFRDAIQKMEPAHLRDDLKMEVMVEVCEWSNEKVIDLHVRGKLGFYVAKVMLHMLINKYSPFYKKYRTTVLEFNDNSDEWADGAFLGGGDSQDEWRERSRSGQWRKGIAVQLDDIQVREIRELSEDKALAEIKNLYWYDQELIKLYIEHGSYRAIEKATGIAWESAYKSIQKSLKQIRCQVTKLSFTAL